MTPGRNGPRRQRNERSKPDTKTALQFVNVVAADRLEANSETRAIVRANAAHFHWRNNRPPRSKSKNPKAFTEEDSCPENNFQLLKIADPHWLWASDLPSELVSRCLEYSNEKHPYNCSFQQLTTLQDAHVMLPAVFPDGSSNSTARADLLQLSMSYEPLLHMFIIGALIHMHGGPAHSPGDSVALNVFKSRAQIVRHMSTVMRDPKEACKDVNILLVSALANKDVLKAANVATQTPNQGPLKSLQFLDISGMTDCVPVHVNGLCNLIRLKGGLENIQIPGIAAMISL